MSKRSFNRNLTDHENDSGHPMGLNGRKIAYSQQDKQDNDFIDSLKIQYFQKNYDYLLRFQYWTQNKHYPSYNF